MFLASLKSVFEYEKLTSEQKAVLRQRLQDTVRKNNYDESIGRLTIEPVRARAFEDNFKHYTDVFTNGQTLKIHRLGINEWRNITNRWT